MFILNTVQVMALVRQLLLVAGGFLVARGILDENALKTAVDTAITVIGGLITLGTMAYGLWKRRAAGIIEEAAKLPEVGRIVATPDLADAIPSRKVVAE